MIRKMIILGIFVLLSGCYFDYPLTAPTEDFDPSLEGVWHDSEGEVSVEVRSATDGYRLRYQDKDVTYLFDSAAILEIDETYFLQARFYGEVSKDSTIDDSPKDHPWLVVAVERKGDTVIMRVPNADDQLRLQDFKNAEEFRSAFAAAIHRDGFFGDPMTFRKTAP
jgi:hypothetical protein